MKDIKVTIAALRSVLVDTKKNLELVKKACITANKDGARILSLPELMMTGHGGHSTVVDNAEPIPEGPMSQAVIKLSKKYQLCICAGIAELKNNLVYNSQIVVDKGTYLGLQRKINLSSDEYLYFAAGNRVEVFDIGDIRFGVTICYDNGFPEISLIHSLNKVDLILAVHAARTGIWPEQPDKKFIMDKINQRQKSWRKMFCGTAYFHNIYILACNAVGSSTQGLENVVANHAGTVIGVDPSGEVFLSTSVTDIVDEVVTAELKKEKRKINHNISRNRRLAVVKELLDKTFN
jgi:predicted amidohydrolase